MAIIVLVVCDLEEEGVGSQMWEWHCSLEAHSQRVPWGT